MKNPFVPMILSSALVFTAASLFADDEGGSASDAKPKSTTLNGAFESLQSDELDAGTEQITSLKVKKVLAQGTKVAKGQTVCWFETEDVDDKIKEAQKALRQAELTFADDEFAFEQFVATQKLDRESAERTFQTAKQAYDNFVQVDFDRQKKSAEFGLVTAEASLANAMEELKQLEQMYKEDDLTEESEEIVLKRAKQAVDSAKFRFEGTRIQTERSLKQSIPRSQAEQKATMTRAQMAHAKSIRDLNVAKQRKEIEMADKREKIKEQRENFKSLQQERKNLFVKASRDGILYHGKLNRGKVGDKPTTLVEGATVTSTQTLVTVANSSTLQIRASVPEKDIAAIKVGSKGKVKITAYADLEIVATVKSVGAVPYAGTNYDCVLSVKIPKAATVVPGMTCQVTFTE